LYFLCCFAIFRLVRRLRGSVTALDDNNMAINEIHGLQRFNNTFIKLSKKLFSA
jgi:hypothetical protein